MKRYEKSRIGTFILITVLVCCFPSQVIAEEKIVMKEIYHIHIGNEREGSGCYKEAVKHKHKGNAGEDGGCYRMPIYHIHTGSGIEGGGCFGEKIYHTHSGDSSQFGGCYTVPQKHVHGGSPAVRGGCYELPVYHIHEGNAESGGGCYAPIYHQHAGECYRTVNCTMEYAGRLQVVRTEDAYCYHHGHTQHAYIKADYEHMSCGLGIVSREDHICWRCQYFTRGHDYEQQVCTKDMEIPENYRLSCTKSGQTADTWGLSCGKTGDTVDFYKAGCGKTESSIEAYKRSCGKNETSVDAYAVNCGNTEETIERYVKNCGKKEDITYARLTITNSDAGWTAGSKILKAACTEVNGRGFLRWKEPAFLWEKDGAEIINKGGAEIEIKENGIYKVRIQVYNEDIVQEERILSILIKRIDRTPPVIEAAGYDSNIRTVHIRAKDLQPDGSEGSGLDKQPYSFDGGLTWTEESRMIIEEGLLSGDAGLKVTVRDACGNIAEREITAEVPKPEEEIEEGQEGGKEDDESKGDSGPEVNPAGDKKKEIPSEIKAVKKSAVRKTNNVKEKKNNKEMPVTGRSIGYRKEKKEEVPKALAAEPGAETVSVQKLSGQKGKLPVIKAAVFTMGSVVTIAGIIWMVYLLLGTIRIYHCDGEGKCYYAGSGIVKKKRGNYEMTIPLMIMEQSCTGRYNLKPGRLFAGRNRGKELLVTAGGEKISVWIDEEIPVKLPACV